MPALKVESSLHMSDEHSQSINASRLNRFLTLLMVRTLRHIRPHTGSVLLLTRKHCVKYGDSQHLSEAVAMKFVSEQTTIPVPKVICAFKRNGCTYIVMRRIRGDIIAKGWTTRTEESKAMLLAQLREYISKLRAIPHPRPRMVAGPGLLQLYDYRIPAGSNGFGPFANSKDFHQFLRGGISCEEGSSQISTLKHLQQMHIARDYPTVFTHGDLSPLNILVRGNLVVGLIDWEMSGWFPDYWEYTSAMNTHPFHSFWRGEVDKFLDRYEEEVKMEDLRRQFFGDV